MFLTQKHWSGLHAGDEPGNDCVTDGNLKARAVEACEAVAGYKFNAKHERKRCATCNQGSRRRRKGCWTGASGVPARAAPECAATPCPVCRAARRDISEPPCACAPAFRPKWRAIIRLRTRCYGKGERAGHSFFGV